MVRLWVRNAEGRFDESESSPMEGHRYGVNQVEFSPNGELLASCSVDGSTILWDVGVSYEKYQIVLIFVGYARDITLEPATMSFCSEQLIKM